ncbi:CheR family methyltransferase [Pararoseomonas sp. SCSIO 73927]|uniref:CheR family methyltransferase n=1 Tax=Pararoseomonas sp. SCSIO 73927 TaxID=3114537 RepID=UPI0030CD8870
MPVPRTAAFPPSGDASASRAGEGLAALAGLAPSAVLQRRLERAAPLLPALETRPDIDCPGWAALLDAVTVGETRLFRAAPQLLALRGLMPGLPGRPLRLLSAGCSSGEEAWSLALLAEGAGIEAEVLGLDINRSALAAAAAGRYPAGPPDALREVPAPLRPRFQLADGWVLPGAARPPAFLRANLLAPPPGLGRFGAILCRNVLIYLLPTARDTILRDLAGRLLPGGALLLGPTEFPGPDLPLRPEPGVHGVWRRL